MPFAIWPDTWYVVARSSDILSNNVFDGIIANRPFVIYRSEFNRLIALDAHCPHMGAHLRNATVVGDNLRCALHSLTVDCNGLLLGGNACNRKPSNLWHVEERFGLIFLSMAQGLVKSLPFSDDLNEFVWKSGSTLSLNADWRAMIVNGFDIKHMSSIHQRKLTKPPEFIHHKDKIVFKYSTCVTRKGGFSNWVTSFLAGERSIDVKLTCLGTIMLVESTLGKIKSTAIFGILQEGNKVRAFNAFGVLPYSNFWRIRLYLTRWLYYWFLRKDFSVIEDMQLNVQGIDDLGVVAISNYLNSLPDLEEKQPS